jgi:hypothetical protein
MYEAYNRWLGHECFSLINKIKALIKKRHQAGQSHLPFHLLTCDDEARRCHVEAKSSITRWANLPEP